MPSSLAPPSTASHYIIGIGIDLAEPSRIARSIESTRFLQRVFALEELARYAGTPPDVRRLAEAFALKEALLKAIGTGWAEGVGFSEVVGPPAASPGTLLLRGRALEIASRLGVRAIQASMHSVGDVAIATVVLWGRREI